MFFRFSPPPSILERNYFVMTFDICERNWMEILVVSAWQHSFETILYPTQTLLWWFIDDDLCFGIFQFFKSIFIQEQFLIHFKCTKIWWQQPSATISPRSWLTVYCVFVRGGVCVCVWMYVKFYHAKQTATSSVLFHTNSCILLSRKKRNKKNKRKQLYNLPLYCECVYIGYTILSSFGALL